MSQTKKHCEPLVAVWLRPSTTEPCICCKQVAEKPRGEHLKKMMMMMNGWMLRLLVRFLILFNTNNHCNYKFQCNIKGNIA